MPMPTPPIPGPDAHSPGAWRAGAAMRLRVLLEGGMAVVRTERVFRNAEPQSIEATPTFPVLGHAVLFDLAARMVPHRSASR